MIKNDLVIYIYVGLNNLATLDVSIRCRVSIFRDAIMIVVIVDRLLTFLLKQTNTYRRKYEYNLR